MPPDQSSDGMATIDPPAGLTLNTNWAKPIDAKRSDVVWVFEMKVAAWSLIMTWERDFGFEPTKKEVVEAFSHVYKDWLKSRPRWANQPMDWENIRKQTQEAERDSRIPNVAWAWIDDRDTDDQAIINGRMELRKSIINKVKKALEYVRANPGEVTRNWAAQGQQMTNPGPAQQLQRKRKSTTVNVADDEVSQADKEEKEEETEASHLQGRRDPGRRSTTTTARYKEESEDEDSEEEKYQPSNKKRRVTIDPIVDATDTNQSQQLPAPPVGRLLTNIMPPFHHKDVMAAVQARSAQPNRYYSTRPTQPTQDYILNDSGERIVVPSELQRPEAQIDWEGLAEDTMRKQEWDEANPDELKRLKSLPTTGENLRNLIGRYLTAEEKGKNDGSQGPDGTEAEVTGVTGGNDDQMQDEDADAVLQPSTAATTTTAGNATSRLMSRVAPASQSAAKEIIDAMASFKRGQGEGQ